MAPDSPGEPSDGLDPLIKRRHARLKALGFVVIECTMEQIIDAATVQFIQNRKKRFWILLPKAEKCGKCLLKIMKGK